MKSLFKHSLILFLSVSLVSCGDKDGDPMAPDDNVMVVGQIDVLKSGTLSAQSSTNTQGMVSLVKDASGKYFVQLSDTFTTKFSTGTVTVYLATSQTLNPNSASTYQLVSIVGKPGEQFFALPRLPDAKLTHAIIWCGAAAIPFGFAKLD
jgi:hypothetical protein